jgi:cytochrome P450 family 109
LTQEKTTTLSVEDRKRLGAIKPIPELSTPEAMLHPHAFFKKMRDTEPVRFDEAREMWEVFRYDDVQTVLQDFDSFSSNPQVSDPNQAFVMINMDPPKHTQFRGLVSKAFTPRAISALAPRIQNITAELLDAVAQQGEMDVFTDLSASLPMMVIAEMLGVPVEDRMKFKGWSDEFMKAVDGDSDELIAQTIGKKQAAAQALASFLMGIIQQRQQEPKNDLISAMLKAELDGQKLAPNEILSMCMLLMVAGNETTTNLITNAVRCIIEEPGMQEQLLARPELMPSFIEEVLRFRSPTMTLPNRFATRDVELGGKLIKKGDTVCVWLGSANSDERKFKDADRFVVDRTPNQHIAFGHGIHYCIGAPLSRLEAQIVLQTMIQRLPNMRYQEGKSPVPVPSFILYGLKEMPIAFDVK